MKSISVLILFLSSFFALPAHAVPVPIDRLTVSTGNVSAVFLPPGGIDLSLAAPGANLVGDYVTPIFDTVIMGDSQLLYTAAANLNPKGIGPAAGTIPGGPVPSGTLDAILGSITVDMSSWFAAHHAMDQNLGGTATGSWDPVTKDYEMSWSATLTQGQQMGNQVTWTLTGSAIPEPAGTALFLSGLGLLGVARRKAVKLPILRPEQV